ncbi:MAG: AraC family transcriptional regulator [Deltaproteobacteria bacterium]|nr:AraC family transcriptional regulator [Deltaproteobacteria bacterium]
MYQLRPPHAALARYIEHYWFVRATAERPFDLTVDVYVDARADLVFNFGVPYSRAVIGGKTRVVKASNLDAQRLRPIRITQRGEVTITGVRFHSGGLAAFTGRSVHAWNDKVVPLVRAFDREVTQLEDDLRGAGDDVDAQRERLDAYFLPRLQLTPARKTFDTVKAQLEAERGLARIDALCALGGVSIRQLDRLFQKHLGFSPKTYSRIVRFQAALTRLKRDPGCTLAEVAAECGYYDQPHFVRECKTYAGAVPKVQAGYFPAGAPADFSPNLVQFVQDSRAK